MATVHVVGAGLAGLSAAVRLARAGRRVMVHEAAPQAGGRCRSLDDDRLGRRIDNGNHLLLSGNDEALGYLDILGARAELVSPAGEGIGFVDFQTGENWRVRPNPGKLPWWIFSPSRRVPGTGAWDYLEPVRLRFAGKADVVTDRLNPRSVLFRRLWGPLAVSALNTQPDEGSAVLMNAIVTQTLGRGGAACLPLVAKDGLSETFVDPALKYLAAKGATFRTGARLRGLSPARLEFVDGAVELGADDQVVLAVPPWVAAGLIPGIKAPDDYRSIVNAHFLAPTTVSVPTVVGVIGGAAEWVFQRGDVASVTISAGEKFLDMPEAELAPLLWRDVVRALGLPKDAPLGPARVVKEKRATFAATPAQLYRRCSAAGPWPNLAVAGDWTDTGLPSTIEGSILSGHQAARHLLG